MSSRTRTTVLVTGVHRSGTSTTARLVNLAGAPLYRDDDLVPSGEANPMGYWENRSIMELNDEILANLGTSRVCPPEESAASVEPKLRARVRAVVNSAPPDLWMSKDPRFMVLLDLWLQVLDESDRHTVVVLVVRDPREVASSLWRRDRIPPDVGFAIWMESTRLALEATASRFVVLTTYERVLAEPMALVEQVRDIIKFSAGYLPARETEAHVTSFVRNELRHHVNPSLGGPVEEFAVAVYENLQLLAGVHPNFSPPASDRHPLVASILPLSRPLLVEIDTLRDEGNELRAQAAIAEARALQIDHNFEAYRQRVEGPLGRALPEGSRRRHLIRRLAERLSRPERASPSRTSDQLR